MFSKKQKPARWYVWDYWKDGDLLYVIVENVDDGDMHLLWGACID